MIAAPGLMLVTFFAQLRINPRQNRQLNNKFDRKGKGWAGYDQEKKELEHGIDYMYELNKKILCFYF